MGANRRTLILTLSGVVALSVAAYFVFHRTAPRPHVNPATQLAPEVASNAPASLPAKRANAAAAPVPKVVDRNETVHDVFRKRQRCYDASGDVAVAKSLADCSFYNGKAEYERAYAQCQDTWLDAHNRMVAAEAVLAQCGDQSDLLKDYFEATTAAAKQGDPDAQLCYLAGIVDSERHPQYTDAEMEEYKALAPKYVAAAFKRGDWRIVSLLATRRFHPGMGPMTTLEGMGQPETIYKMHKLLRLGASGAYARYLDGVMDGMVHPDLNPVLALPPNEVAAGSAWAQETYTQYFSGTPELTDTPRVCRTEVTDWSDIIERRAPSR